MSAAGTPGAPAASRVSARGLALEGVEADPHSAPGLRRAEGTLGKSGAIGGALGKPATALGDLPKSPNARAYPFRAAPDHDELPPLLKPLTAPLLRGLALPSFARKESNGQSSLEEDDGDEAGGGIPRCPDGGELAASLERLIARLPRGLTAQAATLADPGVERGDKASSTSSAGDGLPSAPRGGSGSPREEQTLALQWGVPLEFPPDSPAQGGASLAPSPATGRSAAGDLSAARGRLGIPGSARHAALGTSRSTAAVGTARSSGAYPPSLASGRSGATVPPPGAFTVGARGPMSASRATARPTARLASSRARRDPHAGPELPPPPWTERPGGLLTRLEAVQDALGASARAEAIERLVSPPVAGVRGAVRRLAGAAAESRPVPAVGPRALWRWAPCGPEAVSVDALAADAARRGEAAAATSSASSCRLVLLRAGCPLRAGPSCLLPSRATALALMGGRAAVALEDGRVLASSGPRLSASTVPMALLPVPAIALAWGIGSLAAACEDGSLWEVAARGGKTPGASASTGAATCLRAPSSRGASCASFDASGRVALGLADGGIEVIFAASGARVAWTAPHAHLGAVTAVAWSPSSIETLASCGADGAIRSWVTRGAGGLQAQPVWEISLAPHEAPCALAWHEGGGALLSAGLTPREPRAWVVGVTGRRRGAEGREGVASGSVGVGDEGPEPRELVRDTGGGGSTAASEHGAVRLEAASGGTLVLLADRAGGVTALEWT